MSDKDEEMRKLMEKYKQKMNQQFGEPSFENGAKNFASGNSVAFYKDPFGVVHLRGRFVCGNGVMFTLPSGYRPTAFIDLAIYQAGANPIRLLIESDGVVTCFSGNGGLQSLESITFRAK